MTILRRLRERIRALDEFFVMRRMGEAHWADLPFYLRPLEPRSGDTDLTEYAADGLTLPPGGIEHRIAHDGASIWCMAYGEAFRRTIVLLHSGLGHSGDFAHQIVRLTSLGYRVIVIDSRGHGRSTRDARPYSYDLMASDVVAVMDALDVRQAGLVGWGDGAVIALTLAKTHRERAVGVFFFASKVDPSGVKAEIDESNPVSRRWFARHAEDYAALSLLRPRTEAGFDGGDFQSLVEAVTAMQRSQPNWSADDLASVTRQVAVVAGENDEFVRREHVEYLAKAVRVGTYIELSGVSHFAPIQDPERFNISMTHFICELPLVYSREYMDERGLWGENI